MARYAYDYRSGLREGGYDYGYSAPRRPGFDRRPRHPASRGWGARPVRTSAEAIDRQIREERDFQRERGAGGYDQGYRRRPPRRYERGFDIGPLWGGGPDVGFRW